MKARVTTHNAKVLRPLVLAAVGQTGQATEEQIIAYVLKHRKKNGPDYLSPRYVKQWVHYEAQVLLTLRQFSASVVYFLRADL